MPLTDVYIPYRDWVKDMILTEDPVIGEFLYQMFFNPEVIIKMDDYYLYRYSALHKEPYLVECLKFMDRTDIKKRIHQIMKLYQNNNTAVPTLDLDIAISEKSSAFSEDAPDKCTLIKNTTVVDDCNSPEDCINNHVPHDYFSGMITPPSSEYPNLSVWMSRFIGTKNPINNYNFEMFFENRLGTVLDGCIYSSEFIRRNNNRPHIITDWLFPVFYEPGESDVITLPNPKALNPDPTEMGYHIYVTNSDQHTKSLIGTITYPMKPYNVRYLTLLKQQMDAGYTTIFANDSLTDSIR